MPVNHAVKALIFRADQGVLLQQRDFSPGLPFPGRWTFFGGQVDEGEELQQALRRELLEELGCIPGWIGREIFRWKWNGENPAINHCFPVQLEVADDALVLREGNAMSWFSLHQLAGLKLTPGVSENLERVKAFLGGYDPLAAEISPE